jgi:hypothetical protein
MIKGAMTMNSKYLALIITTIALVFSILTTANAIMFGEPDGDAHPYVGLAVFDDADGNPMWRCSGALISPTVFLTAGHCTEAPAASATIWFEADVDSGMPGNGYPYGGPTSIDGSIYTHPNYDPTAYPRTLDLGVVILDEPFNLDDYGVLPELGEIDNLLMDQGQPPIFTLIGYGLQVSNPSPKHFRSDRVRYTGEARFIEMKSKFSSDTHVHLSSNPGKMASGGYCFGDSGGPALIDNSDVIAGTGSFILNGQCMGGGFYNRLDTEEALDWIYGFLP